MNYQHTLFLKQVCVPPRVRKLIELFPSTSYKYPVSQGKENHREVIMGVVSWWGCTVLCNDRREGGKGKRGGGEERHHVEGSVIHCPVSQER